MTLLLGHRGVRPTAGRDALPPENTLAAFELALAEGADGVELDVRTTLDGELVVFHDADLARLTGGADRRSVAALRFSELPRLSGGEPIPRLADVLALLRGRGAVVNVELKHDVPSRRVLARGAVGQLRELRGVELLVSSFDPVLLALVGAAWPASRRAWLTSPAQRGIDAALAVFARRGLLEAVHLERTQATEARVRSLVVRGLAVGAWTVNDPLEARDLARRGVRRIISDAPGALRAAGL
jgi:glycerophosphoryl diester phosphodiesterase